MKNPLVSVVIPAYNEEKDIGNCLASLEKQSYPRNKTEVIIVDDGSTDNTKEIVKSFKFPILIKGKHKGPGFSRNLGAKKAKGEILIFVDADMTFEENYIKNIIKPLISGKEKAAEDGLQISSNPDNIWSRCWGQYFKLDKKRKYGSTTRAVKRKLFLKLGGFDPLLGYMDDKTLYIKHKIQSYWVKDAICYHANPSTLKEVYKQSSWIGSSLNNFWTKNKIIKYITPILIFLAFPIAIPILSIIKAYKVGDFSILIPWMFIFMTVRYFGTLAGIFKRLFYHKNIR